MSDNDLEPAELYDDVPVDDDAEPDDLGVDHHHDVGPDDDEDGPI